MPREQFQLNGPSDLNSRRLIDALCTRFERHWRGPQPLRIEDLLRELPEVLREPGLVELLGTEIDLRQTAGELVGIDEYLARFPEATELVGRAFELVKCDDRRDPQLKLTDNLDPTQIGNIQEEPPVAAPVAEPELPKRIGRYRIERLLGQGGFGLVYLANDEQLNRRIAVKVPHAKLISRPEDAEAYLAEARTVANLDHPGIVPVHDVGSTDEYPCYVVSKYIDGVDLATRLKQHQFNCRDATEIVATVAEALHYAHKQGLVHRDVKPGNILIRTDGKPFVVDFGLALREVNIGKGPKYVGTPAYMSPEQAQGEGHRVDGRSDIFSLGVVFYQLLAGRKPFRGDTPADLLQQIASHEPKPLLQYDEKLPKELQRICFKALSKRAADRYSSAYEMAEDLRQFLTDQTPIQGSSPPGGISAEMQTTAPDSTPISPVSPALGSAGFSDTQPIRIVPKGLRSFDAHDADFFLELLPGPRDREGLPDSLRFWKIRIEEPDPDNTFSVGLIYGPSGCGKSSLVKAGLLPRLSEDVITVYIEATPEETETRLLHGLRKRCPALEDNLSLKDTLAALRRGQSIPVGRKVLIVLDQFEQWLHAKKEEQNTDLVQALRQCDGGRVQCIVMVRDDFWMAVSRFGVKLEVDFLPGINTGLADLFDLDHARKVLAAFGRAFGKLPEKISETTNEQKDFLNQSVAGLAEEGKVICVRLALFAEMMRGKAWTPTTLKEVGGIKGVGVTFLEETFSSQTAVPRHRLHQQAARAVLKALMPESGMDIKGEMKSRDELLAASGYANRPKDFDDLIRILDSEIRLITPTDPEGVPSEEGERLGVSPPCSSAASPSSSPPAPRFYQLTHDYLVPSLRDWLTRKQRETRTGRAELTLAERSAFWNAKRENRQLPTVTEWLSIRVLTDSKRWTASQRVMMMSKAARVQRTLLTLLLLVGVGIGIQQWAKAAHLKNLRQQTQAAAESLQTHLEKLRTLPEQLVVPELKTRFSSTTNPRHKLSMAFALADFGELDANDLASRIDDITEADTLNYVTALQANPTTALSALKAEALKCTDKPLWRRKTKLAIAAVGLGDTELALDVCAFENRPDPEQRTLFIDEFPRWAIDLKAVLAAVQNSDSPALRSGICLAVGQVPIERIDADKESWKLVASRWFVEHGDSTTHSAAGWLLRHWKLPLPEIPNAYEITPQRDWFVVKTSGATMLRIRAEPPAPAAVIPDPVEKYRQRLAALETSAAAELDKPEIRTERAVAHFQTGNMDRALEDLTFLMEHEPGAALPTVLMYRTLTLARMGRADDARQSLARYREQDVSAWYGPYLEILVPAWLGDIPEASRKLEKASSDTSADQNTMTMYNLACAAARCAQTTSGKDADQSQQFANRAIELLDGAVSRGYKNAKEAREDPDFAILHSDPKFASVLTEMDGAEKQGKVHSEFWVGDREVSRGQFEQFMNDSDPSAEKPADWTGVAADASPTVDHPAQRVSWYDAVMYCNWLSLREGLQPCYERTGTKEKLRSDGPEYDAWQLIPRSTGYRLLHEAEWEYACRAGTTTEYSSGNDETLLVDYCQMSPSKRTAVCGEKLPNAWGLHDARGNVRDWCWERFDEGNTSRVTHGGSFLDTSLYAGPAARLYNQPDDRLHYIGFRVGRTLNPVPFTTLPPAAGGSKFEN